MKEIETLKTKAARKSPTVLIVDDDETLRYTLARVSRIAGFEVREASTAADALTAVTQSSPDAVVCDVKLPDFDGFELLRRLKSEKTTRNIPVLLVTSMYYNLNRSTRDLAAGRARAKASGAVDLMPRGETMEQLVPLLQGLFKKQSPKRTSA